MGVRYRWTPELVAKMERWAKAGDSLETIAQRVGHPRDNVAHALRYYSEGHRRLSHDPEDEREQAQQVLDAYVRGGEFDAVARAHGMRPQRARLTIRKHFGEPTELRRQHWLRVLVRGVANGGTLRAAVARAGCSIATGSELLARAGWTFVDGQWYREQRGSE
jgi:hypothetical protein